MAQDPIPGYVNTKQRLVRIDGRIGNIDYPDITTKEVIIGETVLNPTLMTSVTFQSAVYSGSKNLFDLKNQPMNVTFSNELGDSLSISLKVFRVDNRSMMPVNLGRTEEFTVHACHETMLQDAQHVMSKSWSCVTPDQIVRDALDCVGAYNAEVQSCSPQRDYVAENIHPYQVIQQQCNAALDDDDPSFVHYMTYENEGKHHFRSLNNMIHGPSKATFEFRNSEVGVLTNTDYNNPNFTRKVIVFEFPCLFDYLTDLLNGVDERGMNINSLITQNLSILGIQGLGGAANIFQGDCYKGGNVKQSFTNKGNGEEYGCQTDVETHLLKRQARMALLERDKIALRITVPWAPDIHAGDKIRFNWFGKGDLANSLMPESGEYIVVSLTHKIMLGGFSTSTFDCIKTTFTDRR